LMTICRNQQNGIVDNGVKTVAAPVVSRLLIVKLNVSVLRSMKLPSTTLNLTVRTPDPDDDATGIGLEDVV